MTGNTLEPQAAGILSNELGALGYKPSLAFGGMIPAEAARAAVETALRLSAGVDADAARYRFLRRNWQFDITTDVWMWCDVGGIDDTDKLDATIDERIAAAPRHEPGEG